MASDADTGGLPPVAGARDPEFTHFAQPTPPGEADWSEPTLVQRRADEPPLPPPLDEPAPPLDEPPLPPPVEEPPAPAAERPALPFERPVAPPRVADERPPPPRRDPDFYFVPANPRRPQASYREGSVPEWHPRVIELAADVAVAAMPIPLRVLDVGCGDGQLLAELILRVPYADVYVGLDPLPGVISDVRRASDPRLSLVRGAAEALPFPDACFDLVLATMSLGYWHDQGAGVSELARVVSDTGKVVVVEPAKSAGKVPKLLRDAGLTLEGTEPVRRPPLFLAAARAFIAAP